MRRRVFVLALSMLASALVALGSVISADRLQPVAGTCPAGTHWDAATGTCR